MMSDKDLVQLPPKHPNVRPEAGAVEAWLQHGFAQRFETTISEPLPQELVLLATTLFH